MRLRGRQYHNMDVKGRVLMPSSYKDILGDRYVVTRGLDDNVLLFSVEQWDIFEDKLYELPEDASEVKEYFCSFALDVEIDKAGRILIPQMHRTHAGLVKEVVFIGNLNRLEIWDAEVKSEAESGIDRAAIKAKMKEYNV